MKNYGLLDYAADHPIDSSHLSIDIETFSGVDIGKSGLYKYAEAPDFRILLIAYAFDGGRVVVVDLEQGEEAPPQFIAALTNPRVIKHAYNAIFEFVCLSKLYGPLDIRQWRCTMLHGLYCGYPAGLAAAGEALGLPEDKQKLSTGRALIRLFCTPRPRDGRQGALWEDTRVKPEQEPEKWRLLKEYCQRDVETESEIERRLTAFPVPEREQRLWELDAAINAAGVRVDQELVEGALYCYGVVEAELLAEAKTLTGLSNPNSAAQLTSWLEIRLKRHLPDLRKETVAALIAELPEGSPERRALEIRRELAKTSVKKYNAMQAAAGADGRVRGLLQFYGARTGRWAGRLVQVQNLPRNYLGTLDLARRYAKEKNPEALRLIYGNVPDTLSQLIRTAFVPAEGHVFVVADFSAIEARVIAWLAGERWRLEAFREGKDIYCASASQMFGVPVEKHGRNANLRQKGKIAELALGYQGGVGALKAMGADKMGLSDDELKDIVRRWRESSPRIVELWYEVERAAANAVRDEKGNGYFAGDGKVICRLAHLLDMYGGADGERIQGGPTLTIRLPSGRRLFYPGAGLTENRFGSASIKYDGQNMAGKWVPLETYGGKLVENIVQAIARDCLAETLQKIERAGLRTVMHIHDEVVIDAPDDGTDYLAKVIGLMREPPAWAPDLPLDADGFTGHYYKKE